jgi:hypothetical protein
MEEIHPRLPNESDEGYRQRIYELSNFRGLEVLASIYKDLYPYSQDYGPGWAQREQKIKLRQLMAASGVKNLFQLPTETRKRMLEQAAIFGHHAELSKRRGLIADALLGVNRPHEYKPMIVPMQWGGFKIQPIPEPTSQQLEHYNDFIDKYRKLLQKRLVRKAA